MISMVIENADDQTFICHLYEEYEQLMFWTAAKYLNNIEDRKDAVQDAIIALIRNLETIKRLKQTGYFWTKQLGLNTLFIQLKVDQLIW